MKKIAFINVRYGAGINGGSEVHCRMLAERLRDKYDVEVLTTTLKDFNNPSDQYPAGESHESGITIRRFVPNPGFNGRESRRLLQKSKPVRRLRYWLSQAGVLRLLAAIHPVWNLGFDKETAYQHSTVSYAPDLLRYIEEHRDDYAAFIPMCYFHAQTIFAGLQVPQKSILIPMAHPEKWLFPAIYTRLFTQVRHIAFNTEAERRLYLRIFGPRLAPSSIVGTGIELAPAAAWEHVKAKFNLPDKYALYLGRVTTGKINTLLPDFQTYNRTYKQQSKLVLVGSLSPEIKYHFDGIRFRRRKKRDYPARNSDGQSIAFRKSLLAAARSHAKPRSRIGKRSQRSTEGPLPAKRRGTLLQRTQGLLPPASQTLYG